MSKASKIAIMQPYFFPYLGYFSLIKHTDKFILLDTVQFIRHGWIERNRILKQNEGWLYIKVPLIKSHREVLIKDLKINNESNWQNKILAQFAPYKKRAPYFKNVMGILEELFSESYDSIVKLNLDAIKLTCKYLGINPNIDIFSEMDLSIDQPVEPDDWALNISKKIENVNEYWNPIGGSSFFNKSKYDQAGIKLKFHSVQLKEYSQRNDNFEPGLSILDVLMFNSPEEVNLFLDNYTVQ